MSWSKFSGSSFPPSSAGFRSSPEKYVAQKPALAIELTSSTVFVVEIISEII
jgi:hypothetical protein